MVNRNTIIALLAALGVSGFIGNKAYTSLKTAAQELRIKDVNKLDQVYQQDRDNVGCYLDFFEVKYDVIKEDHQNYPRDLLHRGNPSRYLVGSQALNECPEAIEQAWSYRGFEDKFGVPGYPHGDRPIVYGLPSTLFGKSVSVVSYLTTERGVEAASLGKYQGQCYDIKYEKGKFDSGQGDSVDMVIIRGPINFCVTNEIGRTTCDTRWGEIRVTIKPDTLEQTCAGIRSKEQEAIQNLPSTFSYMLRALL